MAVVENRFVCDLSKPVQAQVLKGNVFSLDNLGSRISVLIYNNGQPATISGSIAANCILPDGSTVNVNGTLTTEGSGSLAYVDIPQSCLLIPGVLKIAVKCTSSSVITTLAAIVANVYMTKTDNVITPSQQIIDDWNAAISSAIATQNAAIATQDTKIDELKSALNANGNGTFKTTERTTSTIAENWRLNESDGLCSSNSDYKLMKFTVSAGDVLKVISDDRFQFQTVASVPSTGSSNRVGNTYATGEYFLKVPETATYLIISTPKTSNAHVYSCKSSVVITDEIKNEAKVSCVTDIRWRNGSAYNTGNATFICPFYVIPSLGADKIAVFADIPLSEGESVYYRLNTVKVDTGGISDVTSSNRIRSDVAKISDNKSTAYDLKDNEKGFVIQVAKIKNGNLINLRITDIDTTKISICRYYNKVVSSPVLASTDVLWRNGSAFNTGNTNYISFNNIIPTYGANQIAIYADISLSSGEKVKYYLNTFNKDYGIVDESRSYAIRADEKTVTDDKFIIYDLTNSEKGFAIYVGKENSSDETVPIRIADIDTNKIQINRYYSVKQTIETTEKEVKNSRHIRNGSATPLAILHFSDLHADTAALTRIIDKASNYDNLIDEKICTGDIVGNDGGSISSWWNPDVLTCIGNHDSAKYTSGSGYDWTYYDMAQRDAWYIAPFESNWGITHTSGTSYYYKDYATQKIRLIVMDVMLYTDNGEEAQTQTAWLKNLLADAITNNLHVLIAIHCPHGGATKKICSFSSYGEETMPTLSDCDTPQTVIDAVAEKIQGGLKFIGYIVGHTHQDNIWDATGDGTQMMYCITCAAVSQTAQWEGSDQFRDSTLDAFNLVTIDTANTLVKIVRGGGADIDMRMRTRKAICFNYSTGEKIGEVL